MKHARQDYDRIQDPAGKIPDDEPVFLIRAQDQNAPAIVDAWADMAERRGARDDIVAAARAQAAHMRLWQRDHAAKTPDL